MDIDWSTNASGEHTIAVGGIKTLKFFAVTKGEMKLGRGVSPQIPKKTPKLSFPSICFSDNGKCFVGGSNGYIYIVEAAGTSYKCKTFKKIHNKAIYVIQMAEKKILTSG